MSQSEEMRIESALLEKDSSLLQNAPMILREAHQHDLNAASYFRLLKQGLAQARQPEDWLNELMQTGQIALARRLARYTTHDNGLLARITREWKARVDQEMEQVRRRLALHNPILKDDTAVDLQEFLDNVRDLENESWYDLALEQLREIDRIIDQQLAEANSERLARFNKAQTLITETKREFLYAEPIIKQNQTVESVRDLLGYADWLSMSLDCDLEVVEEICGLIRQMYQGAKPDESVLARFRMEYGVKTGQPRPVPPATVNRAPDASVDGALPSVERRALSPNAKALFEKLIGEAPSILLFDLTQMRGLPDSITNEESARDALRRAQAIQTRIPPDGDDPAQRGDAVHLARSLLGYWGERSRGVSENVIRGIVDTLVNAAVWRANGLLKSGHWDAACEYYRSAFRLRARRNVLAGMEHAILHYYSAYTVQTLAPASDLGTVDKLPNITPEEVIAHGMQLLVETGTEESGTLPSQGLVKFASEDPWLLDKVIAALALVPDRVHDAISEQLQEYAKELLLDGETFPAEQALPPLVRAHQTVQGQIQDLVKQLLDASETARALWNVPRLASALEAAAHSWEPTNEDLLDKLTRVADELKRYINAELPFQERDRIAESLVERDLPAIGQMALASPTVLGVLGLSSVVNNIQLVLQEEHASLVRFSVPDLEIKVEQSEWRADTWYYCHLRIHNAGEMRAENVRLLVQESQEGEYEIEEEVYPLGLFPAGKQHTLHVKVRPTLLDPTQDAFTLIIRLEYQVPNRQNTESRQHRLRIDHFVAEPPPFERFPSPYVVGRIVEDENLFFGRKGLIENIVHEVANRTRTGAVVIYGQKRSGKSSLLYHVAKRVPDFVIPVWFDLPIILSDLPRVGAAEDGAHAAPLIDEMMGRLLFGMVEETQKECAKRGIEFKAMTWDKLMEKPGPGLKFREFLEQFRNHPDGWRLLYLFDEFTTLTDKIDQAVIDETIMRLFKSLMEHGYFSCIISGVTEVYEAVKRYANQMAVTQPLEVDYLDDKSASELIQDPIQMDSGRSRFYGDEPVNEIIKLTAGSPFYIQMFCNRLVEYMNKMEIASVTSADVDAVLDLMIYGKNRVDPVQTFDNLYAYKDNMLGEARGAVLEGLVVHLIAHETATKDYIAATTLYKRVQDFVSENEFDETLNRLETRRTVLQEADDPQKGRSSSKQPLQLRARQYRLRVGLFKRWLLANRPMDEESLVSFEKKLRQ